MLYNGNTKVQSMAVCGTESQTRLDLQGPLSTWVELQCCQEMLQHLLLGFELDCYLPYEFCMLYW